MGLLLPNSAEHGLEGLRPLHRWRLGLLSQVLEDNQRVHVAFTGELGYNRVSPRDLHSQVQQGRLTGGGSGCALAGREE